ncbi:MAG: hypothetical protein LBB94_03900 [Clostridiales bacterium]|jgi:hypothetical protein|nr:hypothetical protein [Clostridiales bacterium]
MIGYKGFDRNLKCQNFQYEIGKEYETEEVKLCRHGFHFCENSMDVFNYYAPTNSRYCIVEADEVAAETADDSTRVAKKMKIGSEISIQGIVDAFVKSILDKVDWGNKQEMNTGDCSAATNTGDWSAATNTGSQSAATNTGDWSAATNTGDQSSASVEGKDSVAIATGYDSKVKGALRCGICAVERDDEYRLLAIKAAIVDGKIIKADTYYKLVNGEFVEAE